MASNRDQQALPPRFLSPAELAVLLGVPVQTIYQWRHRRTGPPGFRVGRHLRYDPRDVSRWIETLNAGSA
jgi:excisionase family DNA binding protein